VVSGRKRHVTDEGLLSLAEAARRLGVVPEAVHKAVSTGRLTDCVVRQGRRAYVTPEGLVDEWERNRALDTPPLAPVAAVTLSDRARLVRAKADRAELDNEQRAGTLVRVKDVEGRMVAEVIRARTHFEGLPSKLKTQHPELSPAVLVTLDTLIREALTEFATPGGDDHVDIEATA